MSDWKPDPERRRIVCAAVIVHDTVGNPVTLVGPRHWDATMQAQFAIANLLTGKTLSQSHEAQGFIDQFGTFFDRQEAFEIAERQGQIRHKTGNPDSKELFSEDLY